MAASDHPCIALLTDFGTNDQYVGSMKGVIVQDCPEITLIDISHEVRGHSVREAAFLTWSSYRFLPTNSILVCVVDPGVGTSRKALAVQAPDRTFVGPDNGWLSMILWELNATNVPDGSAPVPKGWRAIQLSNQSYWRLPLSDTFHGRDIFAPVAAALARGAEVDAFGSPVRNIVTIEIPFPEVSPTEIHGAIVHIDSFGNLVSNIPENVLFAKFRAHVGEAIVPGPSRNYESTAPFVAIIGSSGLLEIAATRSSAASLLGVAVGEEVCIRPRGEESHG
jgi:S-adenosylmethionine hydrolase